jgi:hypothetical protein
MNYQRLELNTKRIQQGRNEGGAYWLSFWDYHGLHAVYLVQEPRMIDHYQNRDYTDHPEAWIEQETFIYESGDLVITLEYTDGSHMEGYTVNIDIEVPDTTPSDTWPYLKPENAPECGANVRRASYLASILRCMMAAHDKACGDVCGCSLCAAARAELGKDSPVARRVAPWLPSPDDAVPF